MNPEHVHLFAKKANGPAEVYNVKEMNHLLRDQEGPASMIKIKSIYKDSLTKPLIPAMLSLIKQWTEKFIL
ncbi:hypothetical protein NCCP133_42080 [Cytobacillus sp. NCCP-133]|nr:hypothetical protein NCCP133_42080 [Cytobacillus sp. NCCP-133]